MVAKKKHGLRSTKTTAVAASSHLEEEVEQHVRKSPITQVVEVVEEESPSMEASGHLEDASSLEEPEPKEAVKKVEEDPVSLPAQAPTHAVAGAGTEATDEGEKRREMVDELFKGKTAAAAGSEREPEVMPEISEHKRRNIPPVALWAIVTIVAAIVVGAGLFIFSGKSGTFPSIVVVPTPTPTKPSEPSPTPTPAEPSRDALSVQVVNGGGTPGAASKMKALLEEKGYKVAGTGNADAYTYKKTEISVKADKESYIRLLENDLKDTYTLGTSSSDLSDDVSYDARVIVGKE